MRFDNYAFPHPVLANGLDDVDGGLSFEHNVIDEEENYIITIEYEIENETIKNLFVDGKVVILCDYTCSKTVFRESKSTSNGLLEIVISKEDVRGKVQFENFIITDTEISQYENPDFHTDYQSYKFDLEPGDVLGYFGGFSFHTDINYRKLKAVSSFLIIESFNKDIPDFVLSDNKIIVKLPENQYKRYTNQRIAKREEFAPIFHSSIVFSALLYALQNIYEYDETAWAQVIFTRMEESEFQNYNLKEPTDTIKIAQMLLGYPIKRLIDSLHDLSLRLDK